MRRGMFMAAALLLATALGGCAVYPEYGYNYGPGYYATYPGGYSYRYRPYLFSELQQHIRHILQRRRRERLIAKADRSPERCRSGDGESAQAGADLPERIERHVPIVRDTA